MYACMQHTANTEQQCLTRSAVGECMCTCVIVEDDVVPFVTRLQQYFAFLCHSAHVNPLVSALLCDAEEMQLTHEGLNIDECIIIGLEYKLDIEIRDCVF